MLLFGEVLSMISGAFARLVSLRGCVQSIRKTIASLVNELEATIAGPCAAHPAQHRGEVRPEDRSHWPRGAGSDSFGAASKGLSPRYHPSGFVGWRESTFPEWGSGQRSTII